MMKLVFKSICLLILISSVSPQNYCNSSSTGEFEEDTLIGPSDGSLVIVGGGMRDSTITLKFIELAGGDRGVPVK